jgi:hypothetical protein
MVWRNIVAKFKLDSATASPNTFASTEAIRNRIIVFEKVEAETIMNLNKTPFTLRLGAIATSDLYVSSSINPPPIEKIENSHLTISAWENHAFIVRAFSLAHVLRR